MAYEIPLYRFRKDAPREDVERMMTKLNAFLNTAPGFKVRRTYHDAKSDVWIDVVEWESMELALKGMEAFGSSPLLQEFVALADPEFNLMHHAELVQTFTAGAAV